MLTLPWLLLPTLAPAGETVAALQDLISTLHSAALQASELPVEQVTVHSTGFSLNLDGYSVSGDWNLDFSRSGKLWNLATSLETTLSQLDARARYNGGDTIELFLSAQPAFSESVYWVRQVYDDPLSWHNLSLEIVADVAKGGAARAATVIQTEGLTLQSMEHGLFLDVEKAGLALVVDDQGWQQTSGLLEITSLTWMDWQAAAFGVDWQISPMKGQFQISPMQLSGAAMDASVTMDRFDMSMEQGTWQLRTDGSLKLTGAIHEEGPFSVRGQMKTQGAWIPGIQSIVGLTAEFRGENGIVRVGPVDWRAGEPVEFKVALNAVDIAHWMEVMPPQQFAMRGSFAGTASFGYDQGRLKILGASLQMEPNTAAHFSVTDEALLREWVGMIGGSPALRAQILEALQGGIRLSRSAILLERMADGGVTVRLELAGEASSRSLIVPIGGKVITNNFEGDSFAGLLELWGLNWLH
ncbi:MAG: YdbH domain-containing protein [Verrucomicrobia bacterium]|nr:YdbH domain-containing protein [Verrucomicrobiota bacterium]